MRSVVAAAAIMLFVGVHGAPAEMVDIGTGQMAAAEFRMLKAMVQGDRPTAASSPPPMPTIERYGWVEMRRPDFEDLRSRVAGAGGTDRWAAPPTGPVRMVAIGTGAMPRDEFLALKAMVEKTLARPAARTPATPP